MIYDHIKEKIEPFIEHFKTELITEKRSVNKNIAAKGF